MASRGAAAATAAMDRTRKANDRIADGWVGMEMDEEGGRVEIDEGRRKKGSGRTMASFFICHIKTPPHFDLPLFDSVVQATEALNQFFFKSEHVLTD